MFLAGLFEDIGMFVMMHFWPDKYIQVIEEAEKRAIEIRTVEQEILREGNPVAQEKRLSFIVFIIN